jgi:hypothetical protein
LGQVLVNWSAGKQASEGAVGQGDRVGLADDVAVQFGMVVEVRMRVLLVSVEGDRSAEGIGQGSGASLWRWMRIGVPVSGSAESMTPSVPVINGMPSASIAHIAATGGWPVRWTVWPVGWRENG